MFVVFSLRTYDGGLLCSLYELMKDVCYVLSRNIFFDQSGGQGVEWGGGGGRCKFVNR